MVNKKDRFDVSILDNLFVYFPLWAFLLISIALILNQEDISW